jgi:hypothetical protein
MMLACLALGKKPGGVFTQRLFTSHAREATCAQASAYQPHAPTATEQGEQAAQHAVMTLF